jgi:hypothetical protein
MLTISQRAERAARRKNKKIAHDFPLLAEQLAVTVESQVARLQKQDEDNVAYEERLQVGNQRAWERAIVCKIVAREFLPAELFESYEARYQRIYGHRSYEYAGHATADWWWCALRDNDVTWAHEHCPNAVFHNSEPYQQAGQCPTCKRKLTPLAAKKQQEAPLQLSFIHPDSS